MELTGNIDFVNVFNGLLAFVIGVLVFFGIRGGRQRPAEIEVAGAMVDNAAVARLADAVREQTEAIEAGAREVHAHAAVMREHTAAIRALREEMIRQR